jgi:hypothetical protein
MVDKLYIDMKLLDVGKAFEEERQHLDFIVDIEMHLQNPDLDAWNDVAWAQLSTHLQ